MPPLYKIGAASGSRPFSSPPCRAGHPKAILREGRVLVVDDDPEVRRSVRLILTKAGYDVIEAEDGEAGIATVKSGDNPLTVHAIICDLNMPKMSGMEAIPHFRSQFPSCPVIVMTGGGTVEKVTALFRQGVVEFLVKPFDQARLLGAVKKAVNESKSRDTVPTGSEG